MKKIMLIAGLLSLAFLASCGNQQANNSPAVAETVAEPIAQVITETQEVSPVSLGQYVTYDESLLGDAENTVLFFHADWCGTCKTTEANLNESGLPEDLNVLQIDFEDSAELRQKYGVTTKHTFVEVDADGNEISKWQGSLTVEDIQEKLSSPVSEEPIAQVITETEEEAPVALAGSYVEYSESLLGSTTNTVLFFHASWCPPCRAADASINGSGVSDDLTILKVDYDDSAELRQKYGVTTQHTFVQVDADGNLIKKWSGGTTVDDIVAELK